MRNPFAINFGILPIQYISRDMLIDEIVGEFNSEPAQNHCFMLTGVRGSGKTVTLTGIEKAVKEYDNWIVVALSAERDMLQSLVAKLYDTDKYFKNFLSASFNLSAFGIGVTVEDKVPVADIESALELILKEMQKNDKKLLVTVDEVCSTVYMKQLSSTFQIMIRQGYPIFMVMAGLYENIHALENEQTLTFLYRTPKYDMEPLNITLIKQRYKAVFEVDDDAAMQMAITTKGYPFAYQVLGKYIWEDEKHELTEEVLARFDVAMAQYAYDKIWSELSKQDRFYLSFFTDKATMDVSDLLRLSGKNKNEFSQYRKRLKDKGILDVNTRGVLTLRLPRFNNFIQNKIAEESF